MDYAEISVDPKFHRHLIGKGGANSESYVQTFLNQMVFSRNWKGAGTGILWDPTKKKWIGFTFMWTGLGSQI